MEMIEKAIDVRVPVSTVYNQWTQFEEFPEFMEGIEQVKQLDDKRVHWKAKIAGKEKEWDAEIFEQVPDQRIAWRSIGGIQNSGEVSFIPVDANATRITLRISYEPEGVLEKTADALGLVSSRVEGDLKRFKDFIESRGSETGEWRGQIRGREVKPDSATEPRSKRIH
jgi:uncharacterized membrane protein